MISAVWMEKSWGYGKNKTENQRQEAWAQNLRTTENSWLQGILTDKKSSKSLYASAAAAAAAAVSSVVSDSVRPQRQQPTRLSHPWNSPGKNTGVGCHFRLHCMKVKSESEVAQSCPTPSDPMDCSLPGSSVHGTFQATRLNISWETPFFRTTYSLTR